MVCRSLRKFIKELENKEELVRIKYPVSPLYCMAEITDRLSKSEGGGKAVLFEDTGTDFPVLMNLMGSENRLKMALGGRSPEEAANHISGFIQEVMKPRNTVADKIKALPLLAKAGKWMPKSVSGRGECQEVIITDPDLSILPVTTSWPCDGGPFITLPMVHTYHPETGAVNVGMYRMQIFDKQTTGMHWHRHKTGARHYEAWRKAGKNMPVAVALGGDPVFTYAATAPLPEGIDEYLLAGFLRNEPVKMVSCITQDIKVPASADIIIEGYIDTTEPLRIEGPFGDHTGFYSLEDYYPVFHVTCITHRKGAVYPATLVGVPPQEDAWFGLATEKIFLEPIRYALMPEIINLHMPLAGTAHNLTIVDIDKTYPGQGVKAINTLWGAGQMMFNKYLVITDENTDVYNYRELLVRALNTMDFDKDFILSKGPLDVLDHSSDHFSFGPKLGIDLTRSFKKEEGRHVDNECVAECNNGFNGEQLIKSYPNIISCYDGLLNDGMPVLLFKMDSPGQKEAFECIQSAFNKGLLKGIRVIIRIEQGLCPEHNDLVAWQVLSNTDPERDMFFIRNTEGTTKILFLDSTAKDMSKSQTKREWPNVVVSSPETILEVDNIWKQGHIPYPFIPSPSKKYHSLVYNNKAVALPPSLIPLISLIPNNSPTP